MICEITELQCWPDDYESFRYEVEELGRILAEAEEEGHKVTFSFRPSTPNTLHLSFIASED